MKLTEGQVFGTLFICLLVADGVSTYGWWLTSTLAAATYSRIGDEYVPPKH